MFDGKSTSRAGLLLPPTSPTVAKISDFFFERAKG